MYRQAIEQFLTSNKIPYDINGDMIGTRCINPKHIDQKPGSFFFSISKGVCHCFSCGYKNFIGNITEITIDAEMQREYEYDKLLEQMRVEPDLDYEQDVVMPPKAFDITWELRGIPAAIITELGFYYCRRGKYQGRIIHPIEDAYGTLIGYSGWIAPKDALGDKADQWVEPAVKYKHAKYLHSYGLVTANVLYPLQLDKFDVSGDVHLCEGLFDSLSYIAMGTPALTNFGLGAPSPECLGAFLATGYDALVPAFDNDPAGNEGWQKIKEDWREVVRILPPTPLLRTVRESGQKDVNDYLVDKLRNSQRV